MQSEDTPPDNIAHKDDLPSPQLARRIIEALGQFGTPIARGVSYYNVGNESILHTLDEHYLSSYLPEGGAVFKLVVGDYGSGKSHFLYCVQDLAWQRDFVVSKVDLSPVENAYNDQRRIYSAVASSLSRQYADADGFDSQRGLAQLLERTLRQLVGDPLTPLSSMEVAELPEVLALRETIDRTAIDSLSFKQAVIGMLNALTFGNLSNGEALMRWLNGEQVTTEDMRLLRHLGVTEKITKINAFKMLRSLCQTIRALGYTGLVLLFDEGDRMLSMRGAAEKTATDNLREVIDRCRDELPGTMFMYAVPPDFVNTVVPKYQALDQRIRTPYYFSRPNPFSPQISLDQLELSNTELLTQIGRRLLPIFETAYGVTLDSEIQSSNIVTLADAAFRLRRDAGNRRLFIKTLIGQWIQQMQNGEVPLSAEDANTLIRGEALALAGWGN